MWSTPEEVREYEWERRGYPWVRSDVIRIEYNNFQDCTLFLWVMFYISYFYSGF